MSTVTIDPATKLGAVCLSVTNLARSLTFYQEILGLKVRQQLGDTAYLGAGGADLLILQEKKAGRQVSGTTGLYHFAILVPSRFELAQSVRRIAETQTQVQGFADHLVSEAIYLPDPDGHGIEIYRDRPRSQWTYSPDGKLQMATDPIDLPGVIAELAGHEEPWVGLPPDTVMGHIHLHVADLDQAETFYRDILGFDLMLRYGPSASFLSAGGYHHHIGMNTWAGVGAPIPPPDVVGLQWYTIEVPDNEALVQVASRLEAREVPMEKNDGALIVQDPAQNKIKFTITE